MRPLPITPIDARKQTILKAVVTDYVRTAEPVASESLAYRYSFGVKSATIRNELAELSEMGYLQQPHTSAGRVPSDLGYRFYVDRLMEAAGLSSAEAATAQRRLSPRVSEIDAIIEQTCRILSGLARYTSLATRPAVRDAVISHIGLNSLGKSKALVVVVLSNGAVLHELLEFESAKQRPSAAIATAFLTDALVGRSLQSLDTISADPQEHQPCLVELLDRLLRLLRGVAAEPAESDVHMEGASYIVQQPEFHDARRLEALLTVLEQRGALYRLLSTVFVGREVTVIIGAENPVSEMRDCSFVGAQYRIGGRAAGTLGLLGPTRMDYRRAVGAVQFMAANLGELLTQFTVS